MKPATKPLTVRLRLPIHAELDKRADAMGNDKAEIVRQLIIDGLQSNEHFADLKRQLQDISERLLAQTQEIQRLQKHALEAKDWTDLATTFFIAYASGITQEEAAAEWERKKNPK
jgi:hypothetical protein